MSNGPSARKFFPIELSERHGRFQLGRYGFAVIAGIPFERCWGYRLQLKVESCSVVVLHVEVEDVVSPILLVVDVCQIGNSTTSSGKGKEVAVVDVITKRLVMGPLVHRKEDQLRHQIGVPGIAHSEVSVGIQVSNA